MTGPTSSAERAAYDYLRDRILSGSVPGGTPIVPQKVADDLNVSRIPVRDALKHLSAEGLVTVGANRRVVVTNMTLEDVKEIFYMRAVLEGLAARTAAPELSDAVLSRLATLADHMENVETRTSEWLPMHEEFHATLCRQAGMPRLQRELERLRTAVAPYLRVFLATHGMGELRGSKHRSLVAALRKRNSALAEAAVREHIERAFGEIWDVINKRRDGRHKIRDGAARSIHAGRNGKGKGERWAPR